MLIILIIESSNWKELGLVNYFNYFTKLLECKSVSWILTMSNSKLLENSTYCSLFLCFLSIRQVIQIISISKFHSSFLNNKARHHLVKQLISYDYGDIWTVYNINLPYKNIPNLKFIKILFNDFGFLKKLSGQVSFMMLSSSIVPVLGKLGKYDIIEYWIHKLDLDEVVDHEVLFVEISEKCGWKFGELQGLLYNISIHRYLLHRSFSKRIRFIFLNECLFVSEKMKITNGMEALLYRFKDCVLRTRYTTIEFIFDVFLTLLLGKCLKFSFIRIMMKDYDDILEYNDRNCFMRYLKNNNLRMNNVKYVIKKLFSISHKAKLTRMIKMEGYEITKRMYVGILRDIKTHNFISKKLLNCMNEI